MQQHGCSCEVLRTNSSSKKYVIGLKGVRVELEHSWSKAGKFRKYFMPKQHVASLKSHYAIPLFKVKRTERDLAERERTCLEMIDTRIYDRDHSHDGALKAPQYRSYLEKHSSVRLKVSSTLKHHPCVDRRLRFCF